MEGVNFTWGEGKLKNIFGEVITPQPLPLGRPWQQKVPFLTSLVVNPTSTTMSLTL